MLIDIHSHLVMPEYLEYLTGRTSLPKAVLRGGAYFISCNGGYTQTSATVHSDVEQKLRDMEDMGADLAVINHGIPGPEMLGGEEADDWAARMNDFQAGVIQKYPGKFIGWANIGFGSPERSIQEIDRCINELGYKGVQLFSNINQKVLDTPEFMPVYRHIAKLGVPINLHPTAPMNLNGMDLQPLVRGMSLMFDSTLATMRLVMSGIFEEEPGFKLIVPHTGGWVPYLRGRVERMIDIYEPLKGQPKLTRPSAESIDRIYVDTVAHSPETMNYCYEMFGPERIMFGTDHPFMHWEIYREMMDGMNCTDVERELIYHGNAERLLGL